MLESMCARNIDHSIACSVYIQDWGLVIIAPTDDLAPSGARSSAGTELTANLDMMSFMFPWLSIILYQILYFYGIYITRNERNISNI